MPPAIAHLLDQLCRLTPSTRDHVSDAALLRGFCRQHDETAFAALVARHGRLVLRVCRRALDNAQDIEDAFQATFLTLARGAATIRRPESLATWLHGVARRVSLKASRERDRSRCRRRGQPSLDPLDPRPGPLDELSARELLAAVDEEVERLPEVYRLPVLLCCLEGLSQEEVAARLAWTPGSVKGRLERGRRLLHDRLARRGLTLSAALLALEVSRGKAAVVATSLAARAARAVGTSAGSVPVRVRVLAEAGGKGVTGATLKAGLGVLLLGLVTAGAVTLAAPGAGSGPVQPPEAAKQAVEKEGPPRADTHGDALPAEALARLGTLRFRHGDIIRSLAFTPDGKQVISHAEESIRVWEAATGREVGSVLPHPEGWIWGALLTRDGRRIVSLEADSQGHFSGQTHRFVVRAHDRATLKLVSEFVLERTFMLSRFSPDGKYLALVAEPGTVMELWDVEAGQCLRSWQLSTGRIWGGRFSADGKTLITCSDEKVIRFWDVPGGKQVRAITGYPDIVGVAVPSPDGSLLATVAMTEIRPGAGSHPHAPRVRLWDVAAGKEVRLLDGRMKEGRFGVDDVAFAPDGKTLATAGPDCTVALWDVSTGKEKQRLASATDTLAFSPGGETLAVGDGRTVRLIDVASGKELHPPGAHPQGVRLLAIAPDSRTVLTVTGYSPIRSWDAKSGRERGLLEGNVSASAFRLLGDGRTLVAPGTERSVRRWDLKLREPRRLPDLLTPYGVFDVTPDGKTAVSSGKEAAAPLKTLALVDVATGKELHSLAGHSSWSCWTTFSPDGRTLVVCCYDRTAHVWDVASGRKLRQFSLIHSAEAGNRRPITFMSYAVALAPDGRLLAYGNPNELHRDRYLALYDTTTPKLVRRLDLPDQVGAIAFTPDSRMLAWGGWIDPAIHLVEVATGRERHVLRGHKGRILSLTFSADARRLVSGSEDTTALVWDLACPLGGPQKETTPPTLAELEPAWADLVAEDAARAYRAQRRLASAPAEAVPYLRKHLRPVAVVDAQRLARLIADLDSARFVVRQKAAQELEELGSTAEPALRKALTGKPSLEVRNRIEKLLQQEAAQRSFPTRARLRQMRALEALEWAGDGEAQRLLTELAGGMPGVWLASEARAALGRLALRRTPSP